MVIDAGLVLTDVWERGLAQLAHSIALRQAIKAGRQFSYVALRPEVLTLEVL